MYWYLQHLTIGIPFSSSTAHSLTSFRFLFLFFFFKVMLESRHKVTLLKYSGNTFQLN